MLVLSLEMLKRFIYKLGWHGLRLYWFIIRPYQRGAKCVLEHEGKVLLIRNTYGRGHWTFPGGMIERGEVPSAAAVREVREEVGIELDTVVSCGSFTLQRDYKTDHIYAYHAQVLSSSFQTDPVEIAAAGWYSPDNLPRDTSDVALRMLRMCGLESKAQQADNYSVME